MNKTQIAVIEWLARTPRPEISCRTMAFYPGFGLVPPDSKHSHPRGAGAFHDCLNLLQAVPGLRKKLTEMAAVSLQWKRIIAAWSELEETYAAERNLELCPRPAKGTTHGLIAAFLEGKRPRRHR